MWSDLKLPPINLWTVPYLEIKAAKCRTVNKSRELTDKLVTLKKLFNNRASK